ncbi:hypothetical protein J2T60_001981 [Natronospira proteinivora]|uniref:CPXCG motif-containing cysteine-rich protein n=1 Tax=Natronospira proteinivora TaxID=1807133 RepID=A0ABT1G9Q1_9GAMM|nr:CPXCG motif-containing cysteine-rich protein [Natronospira proteinivora]MCP1727981.1 hypothetical protein [Natronospira proteinivora]
MEELSSPAITCPWCFESIEIQLEPESEAGEWVEDCSVCCHPINLTLSIEPDGRWQIQADRSH